MLPSALAAEMARHFRRRFGAGAPRPDYRFASLSTSARQPWGLGAGSGAVIAPLLLDQMPGCRA